MQREASVMTMQVLYKAKRSKEDQAIVDYHLKRLEHLAISHLGDIPQLDKPTEEQKRWYRHRMNGPAWTWKRWDE
jgi:hypothetical protein